MGTNNSKWQILSDPKILKAIKAGVFSALVGSGWSTNTDLVNDRISAIKVILADTYLDKFDASKGKGMAGYCRMVAHDKTVSYVKLHVHINDGAVNRGTVNHTDFTSGNDSEDCTPSVGIHADDSATLGFVRVEQRERLQKAMTALSEAERAHFMALMSGRTSAEWASENGYSAVQANRQKTAMMAKLTRLVTADDE